MNSNSPVTEAFNILDRYHFSRKYGSSPEAIHKAIREETITELRKELRKEILEEIKTGQSKKDGTVKGLSSARGSSSSDTGQPAKGNDTPLDQIFTG